MKTLCVQMDAFMRTSPFLPYEDVSAPPRAFERARFCALAAPDQRAYKTFSSSSSSSVFRVYILWVLSWYCK